MAQKEVNILIDSVTRPTRAALSAVFFGGVNVNVAFFASALSYSCGLGKSVTGLVTVHSSRRCLYAELVRGRVENVTPDLKTAYINA